MDFPEEVSELAPSGLSGLDEILGGGLVANRMYLLSGGPGTGKTTFSLHFIQAGIERKERCLYIAVAGSGEELPLLARQNGFDLDHAYFASYAVTIAGETFEEPEKRIFHSADIGLSSILKGIIAEIHRVKPQRVVIDSTSDLRLLSEDRLTYRRQLLALRQVLAKCNCTALLTDYGVEGPLDLQLEALCYGVIRLAQQYHEYGPVRRKVTVVKLRGVSYKTGWHDMVIGPGGIRIFPSLVGQENLPTGERTMEMLPSGCENLDTLLGGGVTKGTSTIITGHSGTGKTTVANQYVAAAAGRGERVAVYLFEETEEIFNARAESIGLGLRPYMQENLVMLRKVNVAEMTPGEFVASVRYEVEKEGATVVVIDTLNGFASAMPDERHLMLQLHELLTYLSRRQVTTFIVVEQRGLPPESSLGSFNVSYLGDTTIALRFFEWNGALHRAISVIKKRTGYHEATIREFSITSGGIHISEPLTGMHGIFTGIPTHV